MALTQPIGKTELDPTSDQPQNGDAGDTGRVTPAMAQFVEIKAAHPDYLLFYRMGDFYEMFFEDAEVASRALEIVLTKRGKYLGKDVPLCGVPVVRADDADDASCASRDHIPAARIRRRASPFVRLGAALVLSAQPAAGVSAPPTPEPPARVHALKIQILSTMLADDGIGEWGFGAIVEVDGHRILFDTGTAPDTVLENARELKVDLSQVPEVVLSHNHSDHTGGLLTLRKDVAGRAPSALARVHVGRGLFWSRPRGDSRGGEPPAQDARASYAAAGLTFVEHDAPQQILPGVWLTGPVPRVHPERNWSDTGKVRTPEGLVEDTIPEDQSLVFDTDRGLVVLAGCGHAGIVNTIEYARKVVRAAPIARRRRAAFISMRSTTSGSTGPRTSSRPTASGTCSARTAPGSRPSIASASARGSTARRRSSARWGRRSCSARGSILATSRADRRVSADVSRKSFASHGTSGGRGATCAHRHRAARAAVRSQGGCGERARGQWRRPDREGRLEEGRRAAGAWGPARGGGRERVVAARPGLQPAAGAARAGGASSASWPIRRHA